MCLLQMPFTNIPRQSLKQLALFFSSGLTPLGNSPECSMFPLSITVYLLSLGVLEGSLPMGYCLSLISHLK